MRKKNIIKKRHSAYFKLAKPIAQYYAIKHGFKCERFKLKKGENAVKLKIKSATGYTNTYTINVFAEMPATLSLMINDDTVTEKQVMRGDTNGDNKINLNDLTNIKLHLLGKITLKADNLKGADTNKDNKITTTDLANVKLHLLGKFILK
jgi:hypothetical protein